MLKYNPDKIGIEALFCPKFKDRHERRRGPRVILYTFAKHGLTWSEYSPNTIKSCVAGAGNAGKGEVERMVGLLLRLDTSTLLDDTTDALAVALTAQATKL